MLRASLAFAGLKAQAARLLDGVLTITAPAPGQRSPNDWRIARVKVFAERGQTDAALDELEGAIKQGWRTPWLFDDSVWLEDQLSMASVRNNPRFKAQMQRVRQDLAKQRAAVLAQRR